MHEISNINEGKGDGEERDLVANQKEPCHTSHVVCVWHTGAEEVSGSVLHVLHQAWPLAMLAPLALFGCIRASKLRF